MAAAKPKKAAAKTAKPASHSHHGKGAAGPRAPERPSAKESEPGESKAPEYPHTGHPSMKRLGEALKPHFGQRTELKKRPQRGQALSSRPTSAPQFWQKYRCSRRVLRRFP